MSKHKHKPHHEHGAEDARQAEKIHDDDRVIIFDTTLRDGEQSPGFSMNLNEKIRMAEAADELGVDVIEAGFPDRLARAISRRSARDRQAGQATAGLPASPAPRAEDIDRAPRRCARRTRKRIHIFIATSPLHMKYKLQMEPDAGASGGHRQSVSLARNHADDVEWSAEDGTRTEHRFPLPRRGERHQAPAPPPSTCPTPSATRCRRTMAAR